MMTETETYETLLSLTEAQTRALIELLPQIKHDAGLSGSWHLWMYRSDQALRIGADADFTGGFAVHPDGTIDFPDGWVPA